MPDSFITRLKNAAQNVVHPVVKKATESDTFKNFQDKAGEIQDVADFVRDQGDTNMKAFLRDQREQIGLRPQDHASAVKAISGAIDSLPGYQQYHPEDTQEDVPGSYDEGTWGGELDEPSPAQQALDRITDMTKGKRVKE